MNFLLESVAVDTNAASVAINYPASASTSSSSSSSNGGSYNPGIFDTLPHIRLEGLTVDYIYGISLFLLLAYTVSFFLSLFNLFPSTERISGNISE